VKIVAHRFGGKNAQILPDISVNGRTQFFTAYFPLDVCVRHLRFGMNAGIRSARSMNRNAPAFK